MESWLGPGALAARYAEHPEWRRPGGRPQRHPPRPVLGGHRQCSAHRHAGGSTGTSPTPNWGVRDRPAARGWSARALWRARTAGC